MHDYLDVNRKHSSMYGDSVYVWGIYIDKLYAGPNLWALKNAFNKTILAVEISVENHCRVVKQLWRIAYTKCEKGVKEILVRLLYRTAVLLTNLRRTVRPNHDTQHLKLSSPLMKDYINRRYVQDN